MNPLNSPPSSSCFIDAEYTCSVSAESPLATKRPSGPAPPGTAIEYYRTSLCNSSPELDLQSKKR